MQLERQQLLGAAAADVGKRGEGEKLWKPPLLHDMVWESTALRTWSIKPPKQSED